MINNHKAAVLGAFVADALSLGVHWVYNTRVIDKKFGRFENYSDPLTSYHKGKRAGDFTHYGDQMLVLLESLKREKGFNATHFAEMWRTFFSTYNGYFDQATKETLANMDAGKGLISSGSNSDDLAGASRLAALVAVYPDDTEQLVVNARAQTAITHNNEQVITCSDYFARCVIAVLNGTSPLSALKNTLNEYEIYRPMADSIKMGIESYDRDTRKTIAAFGQMCSVEAGLPSTVHLIARYADDFKAAMVENVMAGGDSSARGIIAGMVLAAAHGIDAIPDIWISGLSAKTKIEDYIDIRLC